MQAAFPQSNVDAKVVFVGSSFDMKPEREAIREVVQTIADQEGLGGSLRTFLYEYDHEDGSANAGPQQQLQAALAAATVVICLFGERVGLPLPDDFRGDSSVINLSELEPPVLFPWSAVGPDRRDVAVPLTGTLYELLYARKARKPCFVFIKGDESVFSDAEPSERNFGCRRLLDTLLNGRKLLSKKEHATYGLQTEWLARFIDAFVTQEARAEFELFDDDMALLRGVDNVLRKTFSLRRADSMALGKGLAYYDLDDASQFHGRAEDAAHLLDWYSKRRRESSGPTLVLVEGQSGVGKSSFVRAGLGAALRRGRTNVPPHAACVVQWYDLCGEEGSHFAMLATAIARALARDLPETFAQTPWTADEVERWRSSADPGAELQTCLRARGGALPPLYLALDQFEQLLGDLQRDGVDRVSWEQVRPVLSVFKAVSRSMKGLALIALPSAWAEAFVEEARFTALRRELGFDRATLRREIPLPDSVRVEAIVDAFFRYREMRVHADLRAHLLRQIEALRGGGSFMPLLSEVLTRVHKAWRERTLQAAKTMRPDGPPVLLDRAGFEQHADVALAINDLGERACSACVAGGIRDWRVNQALEDVLKQLVWLDGSSSLRTLKAQRQECLSKEQLRLLQALQRSRLAELSGGRWRLVHESAIDHWRRAHAIFEDLRKDAKLVSVLRKRAEAWKESNRPDNLLFRESEMFGEGAKFGDVERVFGLWSGELDDVTRSFVETSLREKATNTRAEDDAGNPRLIWISRSDSEELVHKYLALFPKHVNTPRPCSGRPPLYAACFRGILGIVVALLDAGAAPDGAPGHVPLVQSAALGHVAVVQELLRRGARADLREESGFRALDAAALEGHLDIVEQLLCHDPSIVDLPGVEGRTALVAAAWCGRSQVVRRLLDAHADPRIRDTEGRHPLEVAARQGHLDVVELFLKHDSTLVDLPGPRGRLTALLAAAWGGHARIVQQLLNVHADPRAQDPEGARALDVAAHRGDLDVVDVLLAHDPTLIGLPASNGATALLAAAWGGHAHVVQRLLIAQADPHLPDKDGRHPLEVAAGRGHLDVVDVLLERDRTLVDLPGCNGATALFAAAFVGHPRVVQRLCELHADARKQTSDGWQALDAAAYQGHLDVVDVLLKWDRTLVDLSGVGGHTALLAAALQGHAQVAQRLLDAHADPSIRDDTGRSALDVARSRGHEDVAQVLENASAIGGTRVRTFTSFPPAD